MSRAMVLKNRPTGRPATPAPLEVSLSVEIRRDVAWAPDDAEAIDALIETRPRIGVFLSTAWLSGLFAEPPDGFEPSILVLREGGALRGIVPLATRQTLTHVCVTLLGGGLGSDRVDLLAARGYEARFADMFLDWLGEAFGQNGFVLELRDVPDDSPLWGAIRRLGPQPRRRLVLVPREIHTLPYLNLDEVRAGLPGDPSSIAHAHTIAKHRRRLENRGAVRIEVLQKVDEVVPAFDLLAAWLRTRWGGGASALDVPRAQRFHRRALPLLLEEGRLRMIKLSVDMRPIAVFYGLATGRPAWWGSYLSGYDREWAGRIHLGQLMFATSIELALRDGGAAFDFLKGAEPVKYLWPVRESMTMDADVYAGGSGAQLRRATRATREAAAALAKLARDIFPMRRTP